MFPYLASYDLYCQGLKTQNLLRSLPETVDDNSLNFTSTDYLGLSYNPKILATAQRYLHDYGTSSKGSRLLTGNSHNLVALESLIAQAQGTESSLFFNSAFQANLTLIPALLSSKVYGKTLPIVFTDKLIHASIHLGLKLANIPYRRYGHLNMTALEDLLKQHPNQPKFIFTESVFSMEGDVLNMPDITYLCRKYEAMLYLDEAHAIGIMGTNGYGLAADFPNELLLPVGSFSKALSSFGGFIACPKVLKQYLLNTCSGIIYTNALPPAVIGANIAAWQLTPQLTAERNHLQTIAADIRYKLQALGYNTGNSTTNIIPIIVSSPDKALDLQRYLRQHNIIVSAIRPPSVPPNQCRLRLTLCAHHTTSELQYLIEILSQYAVQN